MQLGECGFTNLVQSMATDLNAIFDLDSALKHWTGVMSCKCMMDKDRKLRFNGFPSVLQGVKCKSCKALNACHISKC